MSDPQMPGPEMPDPSNGARGLVRRDLFAAAASGLGALLLGAPPLRAAAMPKFKTVTPGVLTVAINGDMPMTSVKGGRLIGTDGDMITVIAGRLGLKTRPSLMEWSATIESVKTGRADIMLGNMGWTPVRAQVMLITDAIYYSGSQATMKQAMPFSESMTVAQMKGHSIGTVTGFTIVPEMKKVPGTTDVKLYDTTDGCIRDVAAGRLDFAMLDAPTVDYMILQNPGWNLKQVPIAPDPAFPQLSSKQYTVMGMNMDNHDLFDAVNAGVAWLWKTRQNAAAMAKYGVKNPDYLVPPPKNPRLGVDRDAEDHVIGPGAHTAKDYSALFA